MQRDRKPVDRASTQATPGKGPDKVRGAEGSTPSCLSYFSKARCSADIRALIALKRALLDVDKRVLWEIYNCDGWPHPGPDTDVCNMIGNIDRLLSDNRPKE